MNKKKSNLGNECQHKKDCGILIIKVLEYLDNVKLYYIDSIIKVLDYLDSVILYYLDSIIKVLD